MVKRESSYVRFCSICPFEDSILELSCLRSFAGFNSHCQQVFQRFRIELSVGCVSFGLDGYGARVYRMWKHWDENVCFDHSEMVKSFEKTQRFLGESCFWFGSKLVNHLESFGQQVYCVRALGLMVWRVPVRFWSSMVYHHQLSKIEFWVGTTVKTFFIQRI